jgi:hypothetical protein
VLAACWRMKARHDGPPRRGAGAIVASEEIAHRGLRDREAELLEFADDAPVAPARILARQPQDQRDEFGLKPGPPRASAQIGPTAPDQAPVPAHQRLRRDRERRPTPARKRSAQRREQHSVARFVARASGLSAQDAELVTQDEDLNLLAIARASKQHEQLEDPAKCQVAEREHGSPPVGGQRRAR